ncbi:sulfur carrier protein ThiS [Bacillus suaedaesalsae]|uniref:Sulfur carrier protein ThiS n=1 Tax=Bacillus suaedaesalsae TaxID=2810349 RepID=A0ABS2DGZ3_9BACI|nr:sulfur carrier protein ThiS [Bacillus suaedaesalsae]MBM6617751.1 sulfur carrier protein ThiS [Bacillus suaedaesalsae]
MKLHINGEEVTVPDEMMNMSDLVSYFNLQEKIIIIEHNHEILEKDSHHQAKIQDGDKIEIVHFVGGG